MIRMQLLNDFKHFFLFSFFTVFFFISEVNADQNTVFWLAPRSNIIIDKQVSNELGKRSGLYVLRAKYKGPVDSYNYSAIVDKLKQSAPLVSVLSYALVTRSEEKGRIETEILKSVDFGASLAEVNIHNRIVKFLDITNFDVRRNIVTRLMKMKDNLGVDGFAVDLVIRTPNIRPKMLARLCQNKAGFCKSYSKGMDLLVDSLHLALGESGELIYNGLFNFSPGQLEDQVTLLAHADAVAIEYFGMNPRVKTHSFSHDILPYLQAISSLPRKKPVLVFARGPWHYIDYAADYYWQRYLFASFLLVKRERDLFKYHASFQVPAHKGRSSGLDIYADWNVKLGSAMRPFYVSSGLYRREFLNGLVVVAPDDGNGGHVQLDSKKFTLEGHEVTGKVYLKPGEALILVNSNPNEYKKSESLVYGASTIASWAWLNSDLKQIQKKDYVTLITLPKHLQGEHDLLLDFERSLSPYQHLQIDAIFQGLKSVIQVVAEVDDYKGKFTRVVIEISTSHDGHLKQNNIIPVQFRSPLRKKRKEMWPSFQVQYHSFDRNIILNGLNFFKNTRFRFKRWSYMRFNGSFEVSSVNLSEPRNLLEIKEFSSSLASPNKYMH